MFFDISEHVFAYDYVSTIFWIFCKIFSVFIYFVFLCFLFLMDNIHNLSPKLFLLNPHFFPYFNFFLFLYICFKSFKKKKEKRVWKSFIYIYIYIGCQMACFIKLGSQDSNYYPLLPNDNSIIIYKVSNYYPMIM